MKAMVLHETGGIESAPLRLETLPDPEPGPGEIRVRVACCAICRTDLHVIEGDLPEAKRPVIPGHQIVGVVDQLGPGVSEPAPGTRVGVAWLRHTCGECGYCARDKENLCESARFTGYHADGGYAEYAVAPAEFVYTLPEGLSDEDAAPLLCSGIIGYRALERCNLPPGGSVALFGFGSSAHLVFQLARHRGHTIYVVSRGGGHQQLARDMGAAWAGSDPAEFPEPVDGAVIFAPVGTVVPGALAALRKGGAVAIAGIHLTDIPALDYEKHLFYERDLRSVTANTRADGRGLLREAAEAGVLPKVTVYPLERANEALADLKGDRLNGSGVLRVD